MAPFLGSGAGNVDRQCAQHTSTSPEANPTYNLLDNIPPNPSVCSPARPPILVTCAAYVLHLSFYIGVHKKQKLSCAQYFAQTGRPKPTQTLHIRIPNLACTEYLSLRWRVAKIWRYMPPYGTNPHWSPRMRSQGLRRAVCPRQGAICRHTEETHRVPQNGLCCA